jgi:hypothetical protein
MYAQENKSKENKSRAAANNVGQKKSNVKQSFGFVDNRPEAVAQRQLQEIAKNITGAKQTQKSGVRSNIVMQLVRVDELPAIYNSFNTYFRDLALSKVKFKQALISYIHGKYPSVITRGVVADFLLNLTENDVISMVVKQLREQGMDIAPGAMTLADQNLQDASKRIAIGDRVHATHLAVDEGLDEKRDELTETERFTEDYDVMISQGGALMQGGLPYNPPVFPGDQTMYLSHPWTTGMPTWPNTRAQVQGLVENSLQVPEHFGFPKAVNTYRSRDGSGGVSMQHVNAYTRPTDEDRGAFTRLYPYGVSIPGEHVTHSRTNQTQSTITPHRHSLTVQYANFREMFRDLMGIAAQYTSEQSIRVKEAFKAELNRASARPEFPPNLNAILEGCDLLQCAYYIISFDARSELSTRDVLCSGGDCFN